MNFRRNNLFPPKTNPVLSAALTTQRKQPFMANVPERLHSEPAELFHGKTAATNLEKVNSEQAWAISDTLYRDELNKLVQNLPNTTQIVKELAPKHVASIGVQFVFNLCSIRVQSCRICVQSAH